MASVIAGTTVTLASTATVSDSTANTNFPVVFHDESNALLDDTGALRYNPSTGTLLVPNLNVAGTTTQVDTVTMEASNAIIFEGATSDAHETTLTVVDPTGDRTIGLPNVSGTLPVLAAASTTQMLTRLSKKDLLTYLPYRGCRLTPVGFISAAKIKRREALVEILLVDVIGFKGDINAMACKIEHAIDEQLEVTLDNMLGYPEISITGEKIPLIDRKIEEQKLIQMLQNFKFMSM